MQRREFIALVGGAVGALPLAASAQKPNVPVIGILESSYATGASYPTGEFHSGLKEYGFVAGQNVTIESRVAEAQYDRLPALVADLIARQVAVIVASGSVVSPLAAQAATKTIPIVFLIGADPVKAGLVASINRPGGNITGVWSVNGPIFRKQLELLHELVPQARAIAVLVNPKNPASAPAQSKTAWQPIADSMGVPIEVVSASAESDFEPVIASLSDKQVDAVFPLADGLFGPKLVPVLARHAMPAIFSSRPSVAAGGLICYGGSYTEAQHQLGNYVGRILKVKNLPICR
jgi:putative tryptophan/tyrosine transport system substrate-binding protein